MAYVKIPEKLLRASTKELDRELRLIPKKEQYGKWFLNQNAFYQQVYRLGGYSIIKRYGDNYVIRELTDDFIHRNFLPVSKTIFAELKIKNIKERVKQWSCEKLEKYLFKTACEIYPEDRVDTEITKYEGCDEVNVTIYYPELKISNSVELEHTLRDIYVRYRFLLYGDWILHDINLTRTSYEIKEIRKGYIFSHTYSSNNPIQWSQEFCYGYTALSDFISSCKHRDSNFIDYFSNLLLSFEEYLQWESLEGKPFVSITTFSATTSVDGLSFSSGIYFYPRRKELLQLTLNNVNLEYDFNIVDGKYVINLKQETVNNIRELLTTNYPDFCFVLYDNQSYTRNSDRVYDKVKSIHGKDSVVTFKGEVKKMNIVDIDTIDNICIKDTYSIHVLILDYIINTLELKLKNYLIKKQLGWKPKEILIQEPQEVLEEEEEMFFQIEP